MVKKKLFSNAEPYAAPVCETLDVNVEGVMCVSGFNPDGNQTPIDGGQENF